VLPSKSENFGMVVPEALLRKIPVIASKGTPWQELDTHNAGWWIDIGVEPLVKTLIEAMNMKPEDLGIMGKNGRLLVEQNYNIEVVSKKMIELYDWVLNKGSKPDFVYE
jgi:glycosyltransferase involved in cell wall biosynthesis